MTPRNSTDRTDSIVRYAAVCACILGLAVLAPGIARSTGTRVIVHSTDVKVRAARSCELALDRDRPAHATRRLYAHSPSMEFRRWAFRLWHGREQRCRRRSSWLNAYPPRAIRYVFDRIGQAGTALIVAGREAGSGDIFAHPFCMRAENAGHLGCFQADRGMRDKYGHGPTALDQVWPAFFRVRKEGWCPGWAATAPGC